MVAGDPHGGREMLTNFRSSPALASTERCVSPLEAQFLFASGSSAEPPSSRGGRSLPCSLMQDVFSYMIVREMLLLL